MKFVNLVILWAIILLLFDCSKRTDNITSSNGNSGSGFTELQGSISGQLRLADSPYQITDAIFVDSSNTLDIEPEVTLRFADSARFIIRGRLTAIGTSQRFITFTALDDSWKGIRILNSAQESHFRYNIIEKVRLTDRDSTDYGAIEVTHSDVLVQNCIFIDNYAVQGGGLALRNADARITNNIFKDNKAVGFGGAVFSSQSSTQFINNTIYDNYCINHGGGLVIQDPVLENIQNNIFFQNSASTGDPRISIVTGDSSNVNNQYNFLWFGNMNPRFISTTNLHLRPDSPCIDAGNPEPVFNDVDGSRNDKGAYGGPLGNW
ncbi:DUF1565 domain-containing protein [Candidatus Saccharibacteria bacterium]|nr:DUF1565 domain-containing protein [Candidatus Saccharibacteria bacterium]NIV73220.1 DUF1565 domain-containing protein [Calditrichia bacterium]NIW78293.1 DUF1565 domain-containing protein [Calditrichia bacterium]